MDSAKSLLDFYIAQHGEKFIVNWNFTGVVANRDDLANRFKGVYPEH